jgi:hypothetical protein
MPARPVRSVERSCGELLHVLDEEAILEGIAVEDIRGRPVGAEAMSKIRARAIGEAA